MGQIPREVKVTIETNKAILSLIARIEALERKTERIQNILFSHVLNWNEGKELLTDVIERRLIDRLITYGQEIKGDDDE
jgi:hypothetical protein